MPKREYKIDRFEGGLVNDPDPRDIESNELSDLDFVSVDKIGKMRVSGAIAAHNTIQAQGNTLIAGYGLFSYSTDHKLDGTESREDWVVLSNGSSDADFDFYARSTDLWNGGSSALLDIGGTAGIKPCFFAIDGVLRVSDGNFGAANKNYRREYIKRNHFWDGGRKVSEVTISNGGTAYDASGNLVFSGGGGSGAAGTYTSTDGVIDEVELTNQGSSYETAPSVVPDSDVTQGGDGEGCVLVATLGCDSYDGWYNNTCELAAPITVTGSASEPTTGQIDIFVGSPGAASHGSGFYAGTYEFGACFVYDNYQPSKITISTGTSVVADGEYLSVNVRFSRPYDEKITGVIIFYRLQYWEDSWKFLLDIDLAKGYRKDFTEEYTGFTAIQSAGTAITGFLCNNARVETPASDTFESIFGFSPNDDFRIYENGHGFKTAVVANRRAYIANVKRYDNSGNRIIDGDSIYKSPPNMYDTFPYSQRIEAAVGDGEETIKLEEFADRLLQFKNKTLYIINISQDIEFLESVHKFRGVENIAATCKTDFGIFWANEFGCYLYDGERVIDLFIKNGIRKISDTFWSGFYSSNISVGYDPEVRKAFVMADTTTSARKLLIYNMIYQSFEYQSTGTVNAQIKTNMVNDWDGQLIYADTSTTGNFRRWVDTSTAATIKYLSKDIDFDYPDLKKHVYKVYISYKGDGSNLTVLFGVDGETDTSDMYQFNSDNTPLSDYSSAVNLESWHVTALTPTTASNAKNIYTFRLYIAGIAGATFAINNITIIYRLKGIR